MRAIDEAERDAWCACPFDDDDPDLDDRMAAERSWLERWHPTTENVFALVSDGGRFLGKYDVPFAASACWRLWAPSARADQGAGALGLLCRHLGGPLPEPVPTGLRFVPASTLPAEGFVRLCVDAGMWEPEAREAAPDAPAAADWIVGLAGGRAIGVALLEDMDAAAGIVTCRHVGVRAEHRRRGYGRALLVHALHAARAAGARRYVDSTEAGDRPMRALFRSVGTTDVGERLVFELHRPAARSVPPDAGPS